MRFMPEHDMAPLSWRAHCSVRGKGGDLLRFLFIDGDTTILASNACADFLSHSAPPHSHPRNAASLDCSAARTE